MPGTGTLAGGVAVVTGGASGIGRAIAAQLTRRGMTVVVADIDAQALAQAAADIGATPVATDVSSAQSVAALAQTVWERFGAVRLVCANAGVASTASIADTTASDWRWLLDVNLVGAAHTVRSFLPLLKGNEAGAHLAFTASLSGFHVTPGIGAYTVSKFALVAFAETLAAELRDEGSDVGVTILCPGPVSTRLGSSQRNRPRGASPGGLVDRDLEATAEGQTLRWLSADAVAESLILGMERGDHYVFTHPEMAWLVLDRHRRIADALKANLLQDNLLDRAR